MSKIPVFNPFIDERDVDSVLRALEAKDISGTSPIVQEFEDSFSTLHPNRHCIAVSNGTVAIDLAIEALGLAPGDEIILPSFTIASCVMKILNLNLTPVFVDCDLKSWNSNENVFIEAITSKTRAIMVVHIYGLTNDYFELKKICEEKEIFLIEDASEAHGNHSTGVNVGCLGDIATYSFYANKHITTGEGGMIVVKDPNLANLIKKQRNLGFDSAKRFFHTTLATNSRIGGLAAALGISQIAKLPEVLEEKRVQGFQYHQLLNSREDLIELQLPSLNGRNNHYWVFGILLASIFDRDAIIKELDSKGIETRPFFYPLHLQPVVLERYPNPRKLEISERLGSHGLYLPMGAGITQSIQEQISSVLISTLANH